MKQKLKLKPNKAKAGANKNAEKPAQDTEFEGYIEVERPVQHINRNESFYRVLFKDLEGNSKWQDIQRRSFNRPSDAIGLLLDAHAKLPPNFAEQKNALSEALAHANRMTTLKLTSRLGWDGGIGTAASFVYFDKTFGPGSDSLHLDGDSNRNAALGKRGGTIKGWRTGLEEPCHSSDHIILAIAIAASGPLYGIIGNPEPAIYHFQGARKPAGALKMYKSSSGKTLSARCAQSLFGASSRTDLFGFNMTPLALEETCFSCNNLVVVLDEEGAAANEGGANAIDPKSLPYRIIQGQGRRRSKLYSASQNLANLRWVVPVITTAEDELDASASVRKEGAQVRMVAIPFPPSHAGGMFDSIADPNEWSRLAKVVEDTIDANFGVTMPRYLTCLVRDRATLSAEIARFRDDFVVSVGASRDPWEKRYAEKFGMLVAAAALMVRYDIAPWTEERAVAAITNLYNKSRSLTVSVREATDALLERLRKLLITGKRFPKLGKGGTLGGSPKKAWGVVKDVAGKSRVLVIKPSRFKKLVEPTAAADDVLKALDKRGMLVKGKDGQLKHQLMAKGLSNKRLRYVCLHGVLPKSTMKSKAALKKKLKSS